MQDAGIVPAHTPARTATKRGGSRLAGPRGGPKPLGKDDAVGVYSLPVGVRSKLFMLLRSLMTVEEVSDKCVLPFLAVAHYLMVFFYLAGVVKKEDREVLKDHLKTSFEHPGQMKIFMIEVFGCGDDGLHVGGRTGAANHIKGQPK